MAKQIIDEIEFSEELSAQRKNIKVNIHTIQNTKLKELIDAQRKISYTIEAQPNISDNEVLGLLVSKYLRWDISEILETLYSALEDSNACTLRDKIEELAEKSYTKT
jgi:hypothetical protein